MIKAQDDVDILAFDKTGKKVLLCEEKYLMFFSKSGFTESVKERAVRENAVLLTIEDLY